MLFVAAPAAVVVVLLGFKIGTHFLDALVCINAIHVCGCVSDTDRTGVLGEQATQSSPRSSCSLQQEITTRSTILHQRRQMLCLFMKRLTKISNQFLHKEPKKPQKKQKKTKKKKENQK